MTETEREARMALTCAAECGDPGVGELVERGGAEAAWRQVRGGGLGEPARRRAEAVDLDLVRRMARALGIRFLVPGDEEWPEPV
ncbi:MAG: DNA processing protein DprA, partial [Actinomycetes bacterium]